MFDLVTIFERNDRIFWSGHPIDDLNDDDILLGRCRLGAGQNSHMRVYACDECEKPIKYKYGYCKEHYRESEIKADA